MKKYLIVLNNDKRLIYLVNKLREKYEVITVTDQETLNFYIKLGKYTHLLLPVPGVDNILTIKGCNIQLTEDLLDLMDEKIILTGLIHENLKSACQKRGIQCLSYLTKQFMIENNYITCEGIIEKLVLLSEKSIYNSKIMIIGYGRLGQILSKILATMKATIVVAARSEKDLTNAAINDHRSVSLQDMKDELDQIDFIINTVPARIIDESMQDYLYQLDLLFLDASSQPYGLDFEYAKKKGLNAHMLPQIPGKIAPKSSGELLANYISLL